MLEDGEVWTNCEQDPVTGRWYARSQDFWLVRADTEAALVDQRKDAEIALAAALLSIEDVLPIQKDGVNREYAANSLPYIVVSSWAIERSVRFHLKFGHGTSAKAIASWKRAILEYAAEQDGDVLWWRVRPEVNALVAFGETKARWFVYSRLLIGHMADVSVEDAA